MVTGSVAEGLCDEYSDIDMSIYYEELPSEEELQLARQQNQGSDRVWVIGDRSDGGFAEAYSVNGVECQFGHSTIEQWEKDISTVLEQHDVKSPMMKAMSGTLICIPLYGEKLVQQWKVRIANYPDALAQAMVEQYLKFFPLDCRVICRGATRKLLVDWISKVSLHIFSLTFSWPDLTCKTDLSRLGSTILNAMRVNMKYKLIF